MIMGVLDDGPQEFSNSPFGAGVTFSLMGAAAAIVIVAFLTATLGVLALVGLGMWNIDSVLVVAFESSCWAGWFCFHGFYYIGFAMASVWNGLVSFFTNGEFWLSVLSWMMWTLKWFSIATAGSATLGLAAFGLSKLSSFQRFGRYLTRKLNGFADAEAARSTAHATRLSEAGKWICSYCYYVNPQTSYSCCSCSMDKPAAKPTGIARLVWAVVDMFTWPFKVAGNTFIRIKNKQFFVLGAWSVFTEYLWAIKSGVCPLLEFVDPVQLQTDARAAAKERMEQEGERPLQC